MVSGYVENNLRFILNRQLEWITGLYFIEGSVVLFEISKCF
jgi:hypothetical protein